jgi:hypothetical protein
MYWIQMEPEMSQPISNLTILVTRAEIEVEMAATVVGVGGCGIVQSVTNHIHLNTFTECVYITWFFIRIFLCQVVNCFNLINKSESVCLSVCLSVCMYVQEKTIYIYIVAQQLKQVQLVTLLEPLIGNSPKQEQNVNIFT